MSCRSPMLQAIDARHNEHVTLAEEIKYGPELGAALGGCPARLFLPDHFAAGRLAFHPHDSSQNRWSGDRGLSKPSRAVHSQPPTWGKTVTCRCRRSLPRRRSGLTFGASTPIGLRGHLPAQQRTTGRGAILTLDIGFRDRKTIRREQAKMRHGLGCARQLSTTGPPLLGTSLKVHGIDGHVGLASARAFEGWTCSDSWPSASAQYISASFRYRRPSRSDFAATVRRANSFALAR
jgi:hypothetical protein